LVPDLIIDNFIPPRDSLGATKKWVTALEGPMCPKDMHGLWSICSMSAQSCSDLLSLLQPQLLMTWLLRRILNSVDCTICLSHPRPTLSPSMWSGCCLTFDLPLLIAIYQEYVTNWKKNFQSCVQFAVLALYNELWQGANVVIPILSNEKNLYLIMTSTPLSYAFMNPASMMTSSSLPNYISVSKHYNVLGNLYGQMRQSFSPIVVYLCVTWYK
jgi:hypothetical protein